MKKSGLALGAVIVLTGVFALASIPSVYAAEAAVQTNSAVAASDTMAPTVKPAHKKSKGHKKSEKKHHKKVEKTSDTTTPVTTNAVK
ncbi:MAG: hypothetical protein HQL16_02640 [Candidatus Omnitrophica bacterium]|nr:hypothetical protein [Candidatus Omnitrophota bacterium]